MIRWLKKLLGFYKEEVPVQVVWPLPKRTPRITPTGRVVNDDPEFQELRPRRPWQPPRSTALPSPSGISGPTAPIQAKPARPRASSTPSDVSPPTPFSSAASYSDGVWSPPPMPTPAPAPMAWKPGGGFSGGGASSSWDSPSPSPSADSSSSDSSSSSSSD